MNQKQVQETLMGLGLSPNEAKVYLAMLSRTDFSATDASAAAEVPTQMIYRILNRMMEKGFCMEVSSHPRRFTITDPKVALNSLIHKQDNALQAARDLIPDLQDLFTTARENENGFEGVKILRDIETGISMNQRLVHEAREEILAFVKPPFLGNRKDARRQVEELPSQESRHHPNFRVLYETRDRNLVYCDVIERAIELAGENARMYDTLPVKATVFDRKRLFLLISLQQMTWVSLVVEHEGLASLFADTFERLWDMSEDYWAWKKRTMVNLIS